MSLVEVKPIDAKKWHGKTGKEAFAQPQVIQALYDTKTGKYATGLSEENRIKLEKSTGFDLSNGYNVNTPHEFWDTKAGQVKLENRTTIFDTEKAIDFIKVAILKDSKFIANSQRELELGLFPDAVFVITDEREEKKLKALKIQKKKEAYKLLSELTIVEKADLIQVLSNKSLRHQSQDFVDVEIDALIEADVAQFLTHIKMDKKDIYNNALVLEAIYKGVLQKEGAAVLYMGDRIGITVGEAIKYVADIENQQLKAMILEKLN